MVAIQNSGRKMLISWSHRKGYNVIFANAQACKKNHSISRDSFPCFSFHWKTVSGKLTFSRDSFSVVIQNELRNALDLMGWIILSVLMRSQDVHSVGKQWNINAPSVTINYMIIAFHFFMDLESDVFCS